VVWSLTARAQTQKFGTSRTISQKRPAAEPERVCFSDALLSLLKKPDGFHVSVFAQGLGDPQTPVVAEDGTVYVACPKQGTVIALRDGDGDGRAETVTTVISGLKGVRGLALHEGRLTLCTDHALYVADRKADGTVSVPRLVSDNLPADAQSGGRAIAFGPDGRLYVAVGGAGTSERNRTILAADFAASWKSLACGVQDAYSFAWQPDTGKMWGVGSAEGDTQTARLDPLEAQSALSRLYCYAGRKETASRAAADAGFAAEVPPTDLPAGSAPAGIAFYTGSQFPIEYHGDAFVALHGSVGRSPAAGFKVVRVRFRAGKPARVEDFLTGFLMPDGTRQFGRPAGVAVAGDGALLVADDENGVLYRISYRADDGKATPLFGKELH
jgi:glucose/arabinose dehydrogenase